MKLHLLVKTLFILMFFQFQLSANSFTMHCPSHVYLDCDDDIWNLSHYGNATYTDYYGTHSAGNPVVKYYLNGCNTGYITREWTVMDDYYNPHSCTQYIYVFGDNFTQANIDWPKPEVELEGCNPNTDPLALDPGCGPPTYDYVYCSQIGVSHKDQLFNFGPDCKKIIRTWTVIDWCTYHPSHNPGKGIWRYYQTIKISESSAPDILCLEDVIISSFNCQNAYVELDEIEIDDSQCGGAYTIEHNSIYADTTGSIASGSYPIGITEVSYKLVYGCGQIIYCKQKVEVIDDKRPVAYCYGSLSVSLMGIDTDNDGIVDDGMVDIWAKDLNRFSANACTSGDLHFSFSPDIDSTSRTFTCEDVGKNDVRMYVTDHKGNQSFCIVEIDIQNNGANIPNCDPNSTRSEQMIEFEGSVRDQHGQSLASVFVDAKSDVEEEVLMDNGSEPEVHYIEEVLDSFYNQRGELVYNIKHDSIVIQHYDTIMQYRTYSSFSDSEGSYTFDEIGMKFNYYINPWRVYTEPERINIKDLRALNNHLNGRVPFDSPYQFIAADINEDKLVNAEDAQLLRQYVNGALSAIEPTTAWKFMTADFVFDDSENYLTQAWRSNLMLTEQDDAYVEFIAIRKGDIVENPSLLQGFSTQEGAELSMRNSKINTQVVFAPNPFQDRTSMRIDLEEEFIGKLEIYNSSGYKIYDDLVKSNTLEIDFIIQSGIYFYKLKAQDGIYQGRIIKL